MLAVDGNETLAHVQPSIGRIILFWYDRYIC